MSSNEPDPTNGIVAIPKASTAGEVYHTRECEHYPETPRFKELSTLRDRRPCRHCTRTVDYPEEHTNTMQCPFCGLDVQPHSHYPCDQQ